MDSVFFFGTLRDLDLLAIVLGRPVHPWHLQAVSAEGRAAVESADGDGPALMLAPGERAAGLLLQQPSETDLARLAFFAGAGSGLVPIAVTADTGPVEARCFGGAAKPATPARAWDFDAWSRRGKAVAVAAAREYMDYFGRMPVERASALRREIGNRALQRVRAQSTAPKLGNLRTGFGAADVEQLSLTRSYTSFLAVQELRLRHRRFDGGWTPILDRTVVVWGDVVAVLPYDPQRDQVLLIEQFRPAPTARGDRNPWCIEIVAGRLDRNESAEEIARREAVEEAGVTLGRIARVADYYPTSGVVCEHITAFVGEADLTAAGGNHGLADEHEDIRTIVLGFDAAMVALEAGAVNTGPALVSLLWLAAHRSRLRREWGARGA